jgi:hypothetical protein
VRTVVTTYATTIAGGILLYAILTVSEGLASPLRWLLLVVALLLTASVSIVAGGKTFEREVRREVAIATEIASGEDTDIEDIDMTAGSDSTRIGSKIVSRGNTKIRGVKVRGNDGAKDRQP